MKSNKIQFIKDHITCLDFAHNNLNWPINKDGDRTISMAPGSENKTALIVHENTFKDFKTGLFGDVIDLCAHSMFDGDKGLAIKYLAGITGYYDPDEKINNQSWIDYTEKLNAKIQYWHEHLRPEDLEYLSSRKINCDTIERLKLGYDSQEERLTIPYFKNGYTAYYAGRDRHTPPDKTRAKYKKAPLDSYNENIPWGLHTLTHAHRKLMQHLSQMAQEKYNLDIEKILVIAEGAFDVMSFEQCGFKCLSPIGGYFNKRSNQEIIDIARSSEIEQVFICFDNDSAGNNFTLAMCKMMFANRINFVCGELPTGIKDVSDYYCDNGDLYLLVKNAHSGITQLGQRITDRKEFKNFVCQAARYVDSADLAELFDSCGQFSPDWLKAVKLIATKCPAESLIIESVLKKYKLKFVEKVGFYEYESGAWRLRSDNAISKYFSRELGRFSTGQKFGSLLRYLRSQITCEYEFNKLNIVNFKNGILDLQTGELKPHDESYLSSIQMAYNYEPFAKCPRWDKFISEIMNNDTQKMQLLQELAGYILFPDCRLQKCFFLMGDGSNGKSVFINVLRQVFGAENCSTVEISNLDGQFEPIRLLHSLVNFANETETNIKSAEARFKSIVAGDQISACYKGQDFIEFAPRAKMVFACNKFINSNDSTKGFLRRIIFINFNRTFEGSEADKNLYDTLIKELPGIFNWTYRGYKILMQSLEFTLTNEQSEIMDEFTQIIDPVDAFFREEILPDKLNDRIFITSVYAEYKEWCDKSGHKALSRQKFTRSLKSIIKRLYPASQFSHSGKETTILICECDY